MLDFVFGRVLAEKHAPVVRPVVVPVSDLGPLPPVKHDPHWGAVHGRGLLIVEALTVHWGWMPQDSGKAVFAVFTREG
jgi:hypothetical protein